MISCPATRQGKWFVGPVTGDNSSAPAWLPVSVKATQTGAGLNGSDLTKTTTGNLYLPPATETLTYDLDGNLQSDGRWSYTWDAENRLIAMQTHPSAIAAGIPIKRVEYRYDADSRRIARAEPVWDTTSSTFQPDPSPTRYIWKNWTLLAEFTPEASVAKITKTYLWGLDLAETLDQTGPTPITLLPTYDSNGNIIALADAATATKAITYEYDAFGQQVIKTNHAALENKPAALIAATESNQWSFSTKPEDPTTGLHYYGYRFYDSESGRWINRDPIEERGGVNLYGFLENDSIHKLDHLGKNPAIALEVCAAGSGASATAIAVAAAYGLSIAECRTNPKCRATLVLIENSTVTLWMAGNIAICKCTELVKEITRAKKCRFVGLTPVGAGEMCTYECGDGQRVYGEASGRSDGSDCAGEINDPRDTDD